MAMSFAAVFFSSAFAACFAEVCTIPLDTAKVRLQLQKKTPPAAAVTATGNGGTLATIICIAREEGVAALWKGIVPGLHRQFLYGGLRIGLYEPVKAFLVGDTAMDDISLLSKILAALTTGVIGIIVANPTDLVKVRLQADGKVNTVKRNYSGALGAYATIIRQEGIGALWTGLGPNIARNAIINAAELASYDQFKQMFLKLPGFTDNIFTHLLAGLGAGFFAVCIGSPVDVVKSRMMGDSTYRTTLDCFAKTLKNDVRNPFPDVPLFLLSTTLRIFKNFKTAKNFVFYYQSFPPGFSLTSSYMYAFNMSISVFPNYLLLKFLPYFDIEL